MSPIKILARCEDSTIVNFTSKEAMNEALNNPALVGSKIVAKTATGTLIQMVHRFGKKDEEVRVPTEVATELISLKLAEPLDAEAPAEA